MRHEPTKISRSRIKRLRGLRRARVSASWRRGQDFCDIVGNTVEVLAIVRESKASEWLRRTGDHQGTAHSEVKDQLSECLHESDDSEEVITRHRKPAGVLIGFRSQDDWFD